MDDSEIDRLFRSVRPTAVVPSSFRHTVWDRIAVKQSEPGQVSWLDWLTHPLAAAAGILMMIGLGSWLGHEPPNAKNHELSYMRSINPLSMTHQK